MTLLQAYVHFGLPLIALAIGFGGAWAAWDETREDPVSLRLRSRTESDRGNSAVTPQR